MCAVLASAIAASATPRTRRVSSTTQPTPDIALSTVCSAYLAQCCTTKTPIDDGVLRGPGDAERALDIMRHHANAELGATNEMVIELPGRSPMWCEDEAVSSNTFPTAYCELECSESCERISEVPFVGDDIIQVHYTQHSSLQKICSKYVSSLVHSKACRRCYSCSLSSKFSCGIYPETATPLFFS